jgi:hypothetical protein
MVASGSILKLLYSSMSYSTKLFIPKKRGMGSRGRIKEIKSQSPTPLYIRCRYQIPEIYLWGFPIPVRLTLTAEAYSLLLIPKT